MQFLEYYCSYLIPECQYHYSQTEPSGHLVPNYRKQKCLFYNSSLPTLYQTCSFFNIIVGISSQNANITTHRENPVGIWCQNDFVSTSMRRYHVASTFIRRPFYVMCPLGMGKNLCCGHLFADRMKNLLRVLL